ncbi:hypothetical protein KIPB_003377, partial [Kipferlia bialata]|eukprot:g3377.t1
MPARIARTPTRPKPVPKTVPKTPVATPPTKEMIELRQEAISLVREAQGLARATQARTARHAKVDEDKDAEIKRLKAELEAERLLHICVHQDTLKEGLQVKAAKLEGERQRIEQQ